MDRTPSIAQRLQTLTLQDLIWLNLVASRKVNAFDYAMAEEAVFRQFRYDGEQNVVIQAAGLLEGVVRLQPFAEGNERTAWLACAAFLALNGFALRASEEQISNLIAVARGGGSGVRDALEALVGRDAGRHPAATADLHRIVAELSRRLGPADAPISGSQPS